MITAQELPEGALLIRYRDSGAYTDCFTTTLPGRFEHARYVEAFYTTPLFKVERLILRLIGRPSTDPEAKRLAAGEAATFAAWTVEARATDQILLCDYLRYTRSWLMSMVDDAGGGTTLYFGSAVVPRGRDPVGLGFRALLGFHQLYARALLRSAARRLLTLGAAA